MLSLGMLGSRGPAPMLLGQLLSFGLMASVGGVIALLIPLRAWRPRSA
jgi:hypothetical protein